VTYHVKHWDPDGALMETEDLAEAQAYAQALMEADADCEIVIVQVLPGNLAVSGTYNIDAA
jgi:hypothetical protein